MAIKCFSDLGYAREKKKLSAGTSEQSGINGDKDKSFADNCKLSSCQHTFLHTWPLIELQSENLLNTMHPLVGVAYPVPIQNFNLLCCYDDLPVCLFLNLFVLLQLGKINK